MIRLCKILDKLS
ncbi:hypothetical protein AGR1B_pAt30298 [Agrobacterium fabacearum S56]|nr:hypothetical protein AGR1B_pAt30298 [Agrobacterium fabacearum S56]